MVEVMTDPDVFAAAIDRQIARWSADYDESVAVVARLRQAGRHQRRGFSAKVVVAGVVTAAVLAGTTAAWATSTPGPTTTTTAARPLVTTTTAKPAAKPVTATTRKLTAEQEREADRLVKEIERLRLLKRQQDEDERLHREALDLFKRTYRAPSALIRAGGWA